MFSYNFDDINQASHETRTPWELLKDTNFAYSNPYIGFTWDLTANLVYLGEEKKAKYLHAIQEWQGCIGHNLRDIQKIYGKLLHVSLVIPQGRAYLTSLKAMLRVCHKQPFLPHCPVKGLAEDLGWWTDLLQNNFISRDIPKPLSLHDSLAFSDASSGVGIGIIIGRKWRAWKLLPGWFAVFEGSWSTADALLTCSQ
jgi:hypothetical protein